MPRSRPLSALMRTPVEAGSATRRLPSADTSALPELPHASRGWGHAQSPSPSAGWAGECRVPARATRPHAGALLLVLARPSQEILEQPLLLGRGSGDRVRR